MNKDYYAVIMAGGVGSRFWPVSRQAFPKQFHDMLGTGESLLQTTFNRINTFIPSKNTLVLTNGDYQDLVKEQLPALTNTQLVLEPSMNNTAPCILLSAMKIAKENPNALMLVAPSDHWIENLEGFTADITIAFEECKQDKSLLMTLGIQPTFPNTGYGYIAYKKGEKTINEVAQFTEKPDYKTAKDFLAQGNYLWNAGIFVWSVEAILEAYQKYLPEMYALFAAGEAFYNTAAEFDFIEKNYAKSENISVDYGIMEKADKVAVLPASFDWSDLGTWGSLFDKLEKDTNTNVSVHAKLQVDNSRNNIVRTAEEKLVILKNVNNYIIVDEKEVLLIYPKEDEQDVKKERLRAINEQGDKYQ